METDVSPFAEVQTGGCDVIMPQVNMLQTLCSTEEALAPP